MKSLTDMSVGDLRDTRKDSRKCFFFTFLKLKNYELILLTNSTIQLLNQCLSFIFSEYFTIFKKSIKKN